MVRLDSSDAFFRELTQMFEVCKHRGAGTVYTTVKPVKAAKGAPSGDSEGWLARAKISNNKARKISVSVRCAEIEQFRERLEAINGSVERVMIAGGAKKRGLKPGRKHKQQNGSQEKALGAKGATGANGTAPGR